VCLLDKLFITSVSVSLPKDCDFIMRCCSDVGAGPWLCIDQDMLNQLLNKREYVHELLAAGVSDSLRCSLEHELTKINLEIEQAAERGEASVRMIEFVLVSL